MSKERARRREAREQEAAIVARRPGSARPRSGSDVTRASRAVRSRLPEAAARARPASSPQRRRRQTRRRRSPWCWRLNVLVWVIFPDWPTRVMVLLREPAGRPCPAHACCSADDRRKILCPTTSSCCPPSTSPTARPCSSCRAWPAPRSGSATPSRRRCAGRRRAPSGSTSSTSTPPSAAATTATCSPTIVGTLDIDVEMSGGIRDDDSLDAAMEAGCRRVNIGTAALEQPEWCAAAIASHGDRIAIGLDVRGRTLAARGWTRDGGDLYDVLARLDAEGCARYVVTDVNKDGMLQGPNLELLRDVCARDRPSGRGLGRHHRARRPRGADGSRAPTASRARSSGPRSTRAGSRSPTRST